MKKLLVLLAFLGSAGIASAQIGPCGIGSTTVTTAGNNTSNCFSAQNNFLGKLDFYTDTGTVNAFVITTGAGLSVVATGSVYSIVAANSNTSSATLQIDGATPATIKKNGSTNLSNGDIAATQIFTVVFDGTNFQIQGTPAQGSTGYATIENNGTPVAQRTTVNYVNGGCVDNAGMSRTDCTFSAGSGANAALSNLSGVAINTSLIPGSVNTVALGSSTLPMQNIFLGSTANETATFDTSHLTANRSAVIPDATSVIPQPLAAASHQFATALNATTGLFTTAEPSFSDLLGSATCPQLPALTGDTTSPAGSCTTTVVAINGNTVPAGAVADQIPLATAANVLAWKSINNCATSLTYATSTHVFGCNAGASNPMTTLGDTIYGGASGVETRLAGPTGPNGIPQTHTDIPAAGAAVAPTWSIPGVPIDTQTGTSYTIPITDDVHFLTGSNASATAWTGFALANNYVFSFQNLGAGLITYTPASGTVNGNATQIIPKNWFGFHYTNNANTFMPVLPTIGAFPDCTDSAGNHINFTAATGALSCGTTNSTGCTLSAGVLTCANPIAVGGGTTAVYTSVSANANVEIGSGNGSGADGGSGTVKVFNPVLSGPIATDSNCSNAAAPAVCAAASTGVVAVPTGTNPTLTVNTSKVTANSRIFLQIDESATIAATTCNTTLSTLVQPVVTARVASTSFTIQIGAILATNPACVSFWVVN